MQGRHAHNVEVFEDTKSWIREDETLAKAVESTVKRTEIILEKDAVEDFRGKKIYDEPAAVSVSEKRTFEAASFYHGQKVCVLNFASSTRPGGGVRWGSNAQEESLCRISTLYPCLNTADNLKRFYKPHFHPDEENHLANDDCIFTPDILVIREDDWTMERLEKQRWFRADVITCAAPDINSPSISSDEQYKIHFQRLTRILNIAAAHKEEVMILGAFGCGAFHNDPAAVAQAMKDAQKSFLYCFKTIEYAVYCSPGSSENYEIFKAVMSQK